MLTIDKLNNFTEVVYRIMEQPTISLRQYYYTRNVFNYRQYFDIFLSLGMELQGITIGSIYKNEITHFNFENDFGELLYYYVNNDRKKFISFVRTLPYNVQVLLRLFINKIFFTKLGEEFLLEQIEHYYTISEMFTIVNLPTVLYNSKVPIQSVKRDGIEKLEFPLHLFQVPKKYKLHSFCYFIKNEKGVVSNINSGLVRDSLKSSIKLSSCGVIGFVIKDKKYKKKYNFCPLYFNEDYQNVLDIYRGHGKYNNKLSEYIKYFNSNSVMVISKGKQLLNEDEFIAFLKTKKHNSKFGLFTKNACDVIKLDIKYHFAKILDYIYDDDFNAIGLIVKFKDKPYKIFFRVMNTHYVDGIENKFVKVGVVYYHDIVINLFYNSEVSKWHRKYPNCVFCNSIKYQHKTNGVCSSCYNKLYNITENISGIFTENCKSNVNFILNNCSVFGNGKKLTITPLRGKQLVLPLYQTEFC